MKMGAFVIIMKSQNAKFITNTFDGVRNDFALKWIFFLLKFQINSSIQLEATYDVNTHKTKPFPISAINMNAM